MILVDQLYEFIIIKGRKGLYNSELKEIKNDYSKNDIPRIAKDGKGIIMTTPSKKLVDHLADRSIVTTEIEEYQDLLNAVVVSKVEETEFYTVTEKGSVVFRRYEIAKYLLDKYHARVIPSKRYMYIYNDVYNIYEIDYGSTFQTELTSMFKDMIDDHETHEIMQKIWTFKERQVSEKSLDWTNNEYINLKNGVLSLDTLVLYDHDPEKFFFQSMIPHNYNPDASCPNVLELLNRVFGVEGAKDELEWVGFCLTPGYRYKEISIYIGSGNTGKSTYFQLLTELVDKSNVSSIEPHDMGKEHYIYYLHHKMINISADSGKSKINGFHKLKQLSGNDYVTGNEKFKPLIQFYNEAKLMIGTNIMPRFDDDSDAVFNRIRIVTCTHEFKPDDRVKFDFSIYITDEEMSGLINESLGAYKRVIDRGGFRKPDNEETSLIHDKMSNRLWMWSRDDLIFTYNDESLLWVDELWILYQNWCRRNELYVDLKRNSFGTAFRKKFHSTYYDEKIVKKKTAIIGVEKRVKLVKNDEY